MLSHAFPPLAGRACSRARFASLLIAALLGAACEHTLADEDAVTPSTPRADASARLEDAASPAATGMDAAPPSSGMTSQLDASPVADAGTVRSDTDALASPAHPDASTPHDAGVDAAVDAAVGDAQLEAGMSERTSDFAVGTRRIEIGSDGGRTLPIQIWYPAVDGARAEAMTGHSIEAFEQGARREQLTRLIEDARPDCPNLTMHAALDAQPYPRSQKFPLVVYSHHFNGSRFSMFTIAEALARRGIVVVAPDHVNGSLFERRDPLTDALTQFNTAFLRTRVQDLTRAVDVMLDDKSERVPAGLRGRIDPAQVGAAGHSLGVLTLGIYSVEDTRVKSSVYLSMTPYFELGTLLADLAPPATYRTQALYLAAIEDGTIAGSGGMQAVTQCYETQPPAAWMITVADVGHFSFADDCALVPEFDECCGMGERIADGAPFRYAEPKRALEIAARYTSAFFAAQLQGASVDELERPDPADQVMIRKRGAKAATP
jgi:Platelet-activating factor acetylhydrolase, isoform II